MESGADLVPKSGNSNSEKNPAIENNNIIRIYLTPCISETIVREKGAQLISFLEKESNLKFELHITKNYDDMIGAFEKGIADVAIMNSLSYIKVNESCGATARLRSLRYGKSTYFGQIIARTDKNLSDLSDLQGKAIAYTDPSSTSGYLFPQKLLRNKGIEPSKTVFAGKHDNVVKMVYEGKVDAGATFYTEPASDGTIRDARSRLLNQYPDVISKVKIIAITDPIPNDPVVFRRDLPQETSFRISLGLIKFISTELGKSIMYDLYSMDGFVRCSDADYDILRSAIK